MLKLSAITREVEEQWKQENIYITMSPAVRMLKHSITTSDELAGNGNGGSHLRSLGSIGKMKSF